MLEQILDFIHNYFVRDVYCGEFKISNSVLNVDFLQSGQYFKITGSVFNDGVHQYLNGDLVDEEFHGEVWAMAVPPTVIALAGEVDDWIQKYGDSMNSPYQSESFGGYSYSKGSGGSGDSSSSNAADWRKIFGSRLNAYRKINNNNFIARRHKV